MARHRIRVEGRDALAVGGIAVAAGVLAAVAGASPTDSWADPVLVAVGAAAAVWAAASAPWWAGVAAAAIAAAFAPSWWLIALAVAAAAGGSMVGVARRSIPVVRAVVAATAVQVLARLDDVEFFGFTSIVAVATLVLLGVLGVARRPRRERRIVRFVAAGVLGAGVIAVLGFAVAAAAARSDLEQGNDAARDAIDLLADGRFEEARAAFAEASARFTDADSALSRPWALPATLVPVLSQHRQSAVLLASEGSEVTESISAALSAVDYDGLRVINGSIDIAAIEALQAPLTELESAMDDLQAAVEQARSPWLVDALSRRLDDLFVEVDEQRVKLANAQAAVTHAPAMLGADGPRVYFLAFTTPSEVRGMGGFMGNWAEITITDGRIEFSDFGRHNDLNAIASANGAVLSSLPDDVLQRYGSFLLSDAVRGDSGPTVWSNLTAPLHFPFVAQTIAELYPQSGGAELDGVFALDIAATAALMEITGPVELADGTTLQPADAEQFLLADQYLLEDKDERVDLLETVANETVRQLLTSTLPSPPELGDLFGPLARQGRLVAWAERPEEQDVFERVGMTGLLPDRDGADGLAVSFNNAGGSKIDYYLRGAVDYDVSVDRATDTVSGSLTVTLRNEAPASGLPDYVIGNLVGEPVGTSVLYMTVFTGLQVTEYTVNGEPGEFSIGTEQGYNAASTYLQMPAGGSVTIEMSLSGTIEDDVPYRLVVSNPPLVQPLEIDVSIDDAPAEPIVDAGVTRLS
jgi:hypothetical protein